MINELIEGGYSALLEKLGVIRFVQWDVVTRASGVPGPLRSAHVVDYNALLFFSALLVFLFILYKIQQVVRGDRKNMKNPGIKEKKRQVNQEIKFDRK
ncbi:MAG: hypothetical protein PQ975_11215 [Methanobacterium sp.]|jgi:hypothetical protein